MKIAACFVIAVSLLLPGPVSAAVLVLSNYADQELRFGVKGDGSESQPGVLRPGETRSWEIAGPAEVSFSDAQGEHRFGVQPNGAYYFHGTNGQLELGQIDLGMPARADYTPAAAVRRPAEKTAAGIITVKVLVDDEEPSQRTLWEDRVRRDLENASRVLEQHCGLRLEVVAVDQWESDDQLASLGGLQLDFERQVRAAPAQLAIGFSRQARVKLDEFAQRGTLSAPLRSHLVIPDVAERRTGVEPLLMLLHELGHWLGATHSPDANSVMRPALSAATPAEQSGLPAYDPVNALAMSLVVAELRHRGIQELVELSEPTRVELDSLYGLLGQALPNDVYANEDARLHLVAKVPTLPVDIRLPEPGLVDQVRKVIAKVRQTAATTKLPHNGQQTDLLIRAAAEEAARVTGKDNAQVFLIGTALSICSTDTLDQHPWTLAWRDALGSSRPPTAVAGLPVAAPTRAPDATADRFLFAALLTAIAGQQYAEELASSGQLLSGKPAGIDLSGLSFDLAGSWFAQFVLDGKTPLTELAQDFQFADFAPATNASSTRLSWHEFRNAYGDTKDERFLKMAREIRHRLELLPGYLPDGIPTLAQIIVPDSPGGYAIRGGMGIDAASHLWFAVCAEGVSGASAHIFEYDPSTGARPVDRGDVVSQLRSAGLYRDGDQHGEIISPIVLSSDGHLYFASSSSPTDSKGSNIWRLIMPDRRWEHLVSLPDTIANMVERKGSLFAVSYPSQTLYRVDTASRETKRSELGPAFGVLRNMIVTSRNSFVFLRQDPAQTPEIIEVNTSLEIVRKTPTPLPSLCEDSHAPIHVALLADDTFVLARTVRNWLRLKVGPDTPPRCEALDWLDDTWPGSLECVGMNHKGNLLYAAIADDRGTSQWMLYDSQSKKGGIAPVVYDDPVSNGHLICSTSLRDSRHYVAGYRDRGAMTLSAEDLQVLRMRQVPEDKIQQLIENAKRDRQPLLYELQFGEPMGKATP